MKQAKEGAKGAGMHGAQAQEGGRGGMHGAQASEGHKSTGKSNHEEASLRSGSLPSMTGLVAHGLKQGANDAPSGESNHETLRHGSRPQPEKVRDVKHDQGALSKARMFNDRSIKGGADPMGGY
jgi:hypothetical protein